MKLRNDFVSNSSSSSFIIASKSCIANKIDFAILLKNMEKEMSDYIEKNIEDEREKDRLAAKVAFFILDLEDTRRTNLFFNDETRGGVIAPFGSIDLNVELDKISEDIDNLCEVDKKHIDILRNYYYDIEVIYKCIQYAQMGKVVTSYEIDNCDFEHLMEIPEFKKIMNKYFDDVMVEYH